MKYCKECLQPDTRPNINFTKSGLCPACNYFKSLKNVDWDERFDLLKNLVRKYTFRKKGFFDCIIGVSGGKDSTRQALWVRDKLNLNPLLVCLGYPPQQVTQKGVDNISNLINLGFDVIYTSPQPMTWKKIVLEGFMQFTNWAKGTEIALISSVPRLALKYDIPLIMWGENPGLQLGDLKTVGKHGFDGNNLIHGNTVAGGDLSWLKEVGFEDKDLLSFQYPDSQELINANVQIIYLGYFWKDWSLINNGLFSCVYGLEPRTELVNQTGDFSKVSSLDEDWVNLNQMIKYYKFGFGRATDFVNEQIRNGLLSREQGIKLCIEYDGVCDKQYIDSFCSYVGISVKFFWDHVLKSVNRDLFDICDKEILPKFSVGIGKK